MNTVGVVALSVLGGMFALALVVAVGILLWMAFDFRASARGLKAETAAIQNKIEQVLAAQQVELKSLIDSARAGFGGIRNDTRALLEDHAKKTQATLDDHRDKMNQAIAKINAEALAASAAKSIDASLRMEKAVSVFQKFIYDNLERNPNSYGPEEFAPEGAEFGGPPSQFSVSSGARYDAEAEREEAGLIQEPGTD